MNLGIIGAGPSGLALSLFLPEPATILESSSGVGGHAASFQRGGFTFDYGPHILFSRDRAILDFIVETLEGNVHQCVRKNKISFRNRLIKYPFENDLSSLPMQERFECLQGFVTNPYKERFANPQNLKEWLLKTFGEGICKHYLFPYNEKVWNVPVENLSMLWADRIPNPPVDDVLKSAIGWETEGYLHQLHYHYPLTGGYQAISESWARRTNIHFDQNVLRIARSSGQFEVTTNREKFSFERLVSTMPIQHLVEAVDFAIPDKVRKAVADLVVNPMFVVSLGIRGEDPDKFTAIYFPESDFAVNRVSFPCTFSPKNGPEGCYSIQAEITCSANSATWSWTDAEVLEHVVSGLVSKGILKSRESILVADVARKDRSYVVYDEHYLENVAIIRPFFEDQGISLLGRFSHFEYINIDQAVQRALELAARLLGEDPVKGKATFLERASAKVKGVNAASSA